MNSLADIKAMDLADPIASFRERFHLPDGIIYLDGNSLGPAPKSVFDEMQKAIHEEWANGLIRSWNKAGWFDLPGTLGAMIAKLVGANSNEVIVTDNTSSNIFKTLFAALSLRPDRKTIVAEQGSFPTDLYIAQGVQSVRPDLILKLEGRDADRIEDLLDDDTAVVLINQVDYRTGELRNMSEVTNAAHDCGAIVVWDLCHSAGIYPVDLNGSNADMAIGCSYKYLNGGPGAPAFVFCAERHANAVSQPLSGWWGHAKPFAFQTDFEPLGGVGKFASGTQPILSLRAMKAGLEVACEADMNEVRAKSMALTDLFIELVEAKCAGHGVELVSPRDAARRGSQASFSHENGYAIVQAMIDRGVIGDFRRPNIMRFGFAPLYISYEDVWRSAEIMQDILENRTWDQPHFRAENAVT